MRRLSVLAWPALALLHLCTLRPTSVAAGTAIRLDLAGLVERADLVLEGRVIAERALSGPANRIDTEYTIAVEHTFFGDPVATRVIRLPGGVLPDGRGMILPGLPHLARGASVLLFLTPADPIGMRMPVGLAQGELSIVTDLDGKKRIVREQADLSLFDPRTGALTQADAKAFLDYAGTLAEIEARVVSKRARQSLEQAHGGASAGNDAAHVRKERR
jgi:hypothetical protein